MLYDGYHFWGMHLVWWFFWALLVFWIFATPYDVPGQRNRRESPSDILKRRFAAGEITIEEYQERKKMVESNLKN